VLRRLLVIRNRQLHLPDLLDQQECAIERGKKREHLDTTEFGAPCRMSMGLLHYHGRFRRKEALDSCRVSVPGGGFVWVAGETVCPMRLES